jgi:hypothetical protein
MLTIVLDSPALIRRLLVAGALLFAEKSPLKFKGEYFLFSQCLRCAEEL